jgi:putative PIN family toxin of toxin-antitoxin system
MPKPCVVVDTSVLVSAFLTLGPAQELLDLAQQGAFILCLSDRILVETTRSLQKPRLMAAYRHDAQSVVEFTTALASIALVATEVAAIDPACRDPDADHVLAAALTMHANFIVTGDADLLALGQFQGVQILTIRTFLDQLQS